MGKFNKLLTALQAEPESPELIDEPLAAQPAGASLSNLPGDASLSESRPQSPTQLEGMVERRLLAREQIVRDPHQVRKYFDPEKLNGLAQTIAEEGVLEDLAVYPLADRPGYYQLVFGERRYRASGLAGLAQVPVRVIAQPDARKLLKLQLIENKHHEDLNPIEEVEGVLALLAAELAQPVTAVVALLRQMDNDVRRASHNVMGQPEAKVVIKSLEGLNIKWRSFVLNQLPLLKLSDDVLEPIRQGKIEYTKALAIARLPDPNQRQQLMQEAMTQNLSIRSIRERIKQVAAIASSSSGSGSTDRATQPEKPEVVYAKRLDRLSAQVKQSQLKQSQVWQDPQKREQLERLLLELEAVLEAVLGSD